MNSNSFHASLIAMFQNKTIAAVVPCYKEEKQIGKVIETMPAWMDKIIIIDDCSPDRTSEVVKTYQKTNDRIILIRLDPNEGVGGAIAAGYKWARDHQMDVAVVMAGDGQMDPKDLPSILGPVVSGHADYSKGNRLIVGESFKKIPKVRFIGNSALSFLTKIASGYWHVSDTQSGYTAINAKALKVIDWDKMYKRYGQPNDLLVSLNIHNFKVADVPNEPVYNVGEVSKMNIKRVLFSMSKLLFKLYLKRMWEKYIVRDFHPLVFFYAMGFLQFIICSIFSVRLLYLWTTQGTMPQVTLLILLFSFSVGLQSIVFAMLFDMNANRDLKVQV